MIFGTPEFTDHLLDVVIRDKRHDLYQKTVDTANKMAIHVYGDKPTEILERVRPREPDEIKKYRLDNYEPTTKSTAGKALSIVSKIFNPSLYNIFWKDQNTNAQKLEQYALEYYPKHNSVLKFLSQAGLKRMIADPNGVFAVRPVKLPANDSEMVSPEIKVFGSSAIWDYDADHFLIHIKTEEVKKGKLFTFEYYDAVQVIDFTVLVINQKQIDLTVTFQYEHLFGEIPVWFLTGETETDANGSEYYISFFDAAVPFWNKAITHESDLDAAFINHLHPQKVVVAEDCDFTVDLQRCQHGQILGKDGQYNTCPSCHGSGKKIPIGPFGVHLVAREKLDAGQPMNVPVQYVTVPTDPTKMLKERVDEQHRKGLEALNMDIIDNVGENQSGIAKVIDRGELYDFLYKISDVVFDTHLQNIFYFFNLYMFAFYDVSRNKDFSKNLPEINKPVSFDLTSVTEMTGEYKVAKESSTNPEYLRQKQIAMASKDYANNPDVKQRIVTILELDPLPEITPADMEAKLSTGTISKRDAVIHDNIGAFIDKATQDDKSFYSLPKEQKLEVVRKYAEVFLKENRASLEVSMSVDPDEDDAEGTRGAA